MIELSTLTGACMVALGERSAGLFSNQAELATALQASGKSVEEPMWHMPILEDIRESIKGTYCDLNNIAAGRYGGAIVAAAFLVASADPRSASCTQASLGRTWTSQAQRTRASRSASTVRAARGSASARCWSTADRRLQFNLIVLSC